MNENEIYRVKCNLSAIPCFVNPIILMKNSKHRIDVLLERKSLYGEFWSTKRKSEYFGYISIDPLNVAFRILSFIPQIDSLEILIDHVDPKYQSMIVMENMVPRIIGSENDPTTYQLITVDLHLTKKGGDIA